MLEIADGATPEDVLPLDARVLRQDACYRLAELALASGQPAEALARAERGLALGDELDVFSANLHIARGRALEGLARPVEAAAAYHRALVVHEALLAEALSEGGAS
jgi:tetratricopeptide (TPR) repeat protein